MMKLLVIVALFGAVAAMPQGFLPQNQIIRILSQNQESDPAGPYQWSFQTENGISFAEQGALVGRGEDAAVAKQGQFSYPGDDGQTYSITYTADENGYQPQGAHLPTPPPIPVEILRSLEANARDEGRFDERGFLKK